MLGVLPTLALGQQNRLPGNQELSDVPNSPGGPLYGSNLEAAIAEIGDSQADRATPQQVAYREQSVDAYTDLSPQEAQKLLVDRFAAELASVTQEPAEMLQRADRVRGYRGDGIALIDPAGPEDRAMVVSTMPLRTADGELPDLDLERGGGEVAPAQPLADVSIPDRLADGAALDDADVELSFEGAAPGDPQSRLISTSGAGSDKEATFYPEVMEDTDVVLAPVPRGIETFAQLRSADSPEQVALDVGVPNGGEVKEDGLGGALVVNSSGEPVASAQAPLAVDAQGTPVPVSMEVQSQRVVLHVPHQNQDFAYPILVDPVWEYWNWYQGQNLDAFGQFTYTSFGNPNYIGQTTCNTVQYSCEGSGRGLYVFAPALTWVQANSQAWWYYTVPGASTYINQSAVYFYRFYRGPTGTAYYPYGFFGLMNSAGAWETAYTYINDSASYQWLYGTGGAKYFVMGLASCCTVKTPGYWRYMRVGEMNAELRDGENPTMLGPAPANTAWMNGTSDIQVLASAQDNGLGVKRLQVQGLSAGGGDYTEAYEHPCIGTRGSACPSPLAHLFNYHTVGLAEGISTVYVKAVDALGKSSGSQSFQAKVDKQGPVISLTDQLASTTKETGTSDDEHVPEELSLPTYDLDITATDGSAQAPRSGVKSIKVSLDGVVQQVPWQDQTCPQGSCSKHEHFQLELSDELPPGEHALRVDATDQVGNSRSHTIEFDYHPATGILDEYVMQYAPFPDGSRLAVNVTNGNLVYETTDLLFPGTDRNLEVKRFYNSATDSGEAGKGWTLNAGSDVSISPGGGEVSVQASGGHDETLDDPAAGEEVFSPPLEGTLSQNGTGYRLTDDSTGSEQTFDAQGRLTRDEDAVGTTQTSVYSGPDLAEIQTSDGAHTDVANSQGYVAGLSGDGGEHEYTHEGGELTEYEAPDGTAHYDYTDGRLTSIEQPDGSTAAIEYDELGRVTEIDLTPVGESANETSLSYEDRATTVTDPQGTETKYNIGADGSVLSSRAGVAQLVLTVDGSFKAHASDPGGLLPSGQHTLHAVLEGPNLHQVEVDIDGTVDEIEECPASPCELSFVADTEQLPAGAATFEVFGIANAGSVSERFDVVIPPPPPSTDDGFDPGPTFAEAKDFRERFGLASDDQTVLDTLNDVSLESSIEEFGVPLRPAEVDELHFRDAYVEEAGQSLPSFFAAAAPDTYGGYRVAHSEGGLIYVSFTAAEEDPEELLSDYASQFSAPDRLRVDPNPAEYSSQSLEATADQVLEDERLDAPASADVSVLFAGEDPYSGRATVAVPTDTPATAKQQLESHYGPEVDVQEVSWTFDDGGRKKIHRPLLAGIEIKGSDGGACTMGFGARRFKGYKRGEPRYIYAALTASHCWRYGTLPKFQGGRAYTNSRIIGDIFNEEPLPNVVHGIPALDITAFQLLDQDWIARAVFAQRGHYPLVKALHERDEPLGERRCISGISSGTDCGSIKYAFKTPDQGIPVRLATYSSLPGDSGGPIFKKHVAIGINNGTMKYKGTRYGRYTPIRAGQEAIDVTVVTSP